MANSKINLDTYAENTWCPGCFNFVIERVVKEAIIELIKKGYKKENFVLVSGIGCHAKIVDYINLNSFYSIHGRVLPVAEGIKIANPNLIVIGFGGDGDTYAEGLSHLIFAAKRNFDITLLVHNNRTFALTTGQYTPTSPKGFVGGSSPKGTKEEPFNPIELMLASGATFVARAYAGDPIHLKKIIISAIKHKGFSFIDVLQPCVTFFNTSKLYKERVYKLEDIHHDKKNYQLALKRAREWDYSSENQDIPIGIFYQTKRKTFEEIVDPPKRRNSKAISKILKTSI